MYQQKARGFHFQVFGGASAGVAIRSNIGVKAPLVALGTSQAATGPVCSALQSLLLLETEARYTLTILTRQQRPRGPTGGAAERNGSGKERLSISILQNKSFVIERILNKMDDRVKTTKPF